MCAYCHLEHPKISQPRPRKVTRDKIKTRHETAPAQSQQIEATFVPVGAGRPLTAALLAALQDHGNDTCNPCVFFNSAQGCRHGRMCAYCHLEHPKISQPRPRKVTRDKIKTRHETAPAQSQQIEATFVPVGAGRPLTAALLAALQDHGNDTCNPCVFFNSAQGCRHERMCAYCHLEHPKISQPRPRKVTRDKIKTRIEECLQGPADQVHVSLQEEALGHAYARSLIRGYLDDMAEPKEDPQHVVHLFL
ncbi:unnamed protein product [Cladocopium goreaui]|uniref:Uncharacterized protein n=1 Tax=Cladocopium goreaui TaxID=2562237 RepID=A0A9P1BNL9_9DINO|nr:unnamed protein product [Cladocopium goreaui]